MKRTSYFQIRFSNFFTKNISSIRIKIVFSFIYSSYIEDDNLDFIHTKNNTLFVINDKLRSADNKQLCFCPELALPWEETIDDCDIFIEQFVL